MRGVSSSGVHHQSWKTPHEMWYVHKPDVSKLRIWGNFYPKEKQPKLDALSQACYFVDYAVNGYRLWDCRKQKVYLARDVIIDESRYESTTAVKNASDNNEQQFGYNRNPRWKSEMSWKNRVGERCPSWSTDRKPGQ